jgi:hypothetical protein
VPRLESAAPRMIALASVSAVLLMRMRWSLHRVIAVAAALSLLIERSRHALSAARMR